MELTIKLTLFIMNERQIIFHGHYFQDFYLKVSDNVKEKIGYVFRLIKTIDMIPEKFMKHITGSDGLYEIRVKAGRNIYRIFCCFDKGNTIVLLNAFQKKTGKTPKQEIIQAVKLKNEYSISKEKQNEKK